MKLQLAACLLLLTILQLYHLPPPLPPRQWLFLHVHLMPDTQVSCCTVLPYFSRQWTIWLKMFIFCLLFVYYFDYITVQYYTADCISWVPRLILLDFGTNWTYQCSLGIELICMYRNYCDVWTCNWIWGWEHQSTKSSQYLDLEKDQHREGLGTESVWLSWEDRDRRWKITSNDHG